jgi:hypothetical protein
MSPGYQLLLGHLLLLLITIQFFEQKNSEPPNPYYSMESRSGYMLQKTYYIFQRGRTR